MALYLVLHSPNDDERADVLQPTRLLDMARDAEQGTSRPRWISTFSPDLHDDRIFSLWEAAEGDDVLAALERYGFLNNMSAQPIRVQQWGPADVLATDHQARE